MYIQKRSINAAVNKEWVFSGRGGTLDYLPRYLYIQHYLHKAARRLKRQIHSSRRMSPEYENIE
jgi:hypothetical protein